MAVPNLDWKVALSDWTGTQLGTNANPLVTAIAGGGGGGTAAVDEVAWTAGASLFNPAGGVFNDAAAALTAGQQGTQRLTPNRGLHVNLRSQNGTEVLPVPAALADATANPTLSELQTFPMSWDQTNSKWNRVLGTQPFLTGVTPSTGAAGLLGAASVVYNATADTLVVQRSLASLADGIAGGATVGMGAYAWNAATWDRLRTVAAATGTTGTGVLAAGPVLFDSVGGTNFVKQAGDASGRAIVVGGGAVGAAASGNPVTIAGVDGGALKRILLTDTTGAVVHLGTLTHNNAVPAATNLGVLPGLANAAAPTYIEADQVLASLNLHGDTRVISAGHTPAAPTCTFTRGANTTAYTIGDEVGTAGTAPTTIAVARYNGGSGLILGAQVVYSSYAAVIPQLVLLLFSATVTLAGDNLQLNLSDGDAALMIGWIPLNVVLSGQYSAGAPVAAGNTVFQGVPQNPFEYICGASQQTIYAALVTLNAFTPIANSETAIVTLRVENN